MSSNPLPLSGFFLSIIHSSPVLLRSSARRFYLSTHSTIFHEALKLTPQKNLIFKPTFFPPIRSRCGRFLLINQFFLNGHLRQSPFALLRTSYGYVHYFTNKHLKKESEMIFSKKSRFAEDDNDR